MTKIPTIAHRRLISQRISTPTANDPLDIVRWMGAMQAQDYHQAVWALGARMAQPSLRAVEAALANETIVRAWPMRGTIHFVPAQDAGWMLRLTAVRMIAKDARRQQQLALDGAILSRCEVVITATLQGKNRLTRPQLFALLEAAGISTDKQRGYKILWYLAHLGILYIGAMVDKQPTFGLLDECAPNARQLDGQDAWTELARRYFRSHSPATAADFAWWAGITLTEARAAIYNTGSELVSETVTGVTYWHLSTEQINEPSTGVILLPGFDEFFLGYKDRRDMIDAAHLARVCPGGNGIFHPMIVVDGQIVGTWRRTLKRDSVVIETNIFPGHAPVEQEALAAAAQRYADFQQLALRLQPGKNDTAG